MYKEFKGTLQAEFEEGSNAYIDTVPCNLDNLITMIGLGSAVREVRAKKNFFDDLDEELNNEIKQRQHHELEKQMAS